MSLKQLAAFIAVFSVTGVSYALDSDTRSDLSYQTDVSDNDASLNANANLDTNNDVDVSVNTNRDRDMSYSQDTSMSGAQVALGENERGVRVRDNTTGREIVVTTVDDYHEPARHYPTMQEKIGMEDNRDLVAIDNGEDVGIIGNDTFHPSLEEFIESNYPTWNEVANNDHLYPDEGDAIEHLSQMIPTMEGHLAAKRDVMEGDTRYTYLGDVNGQETYTQTAFLDRNDRFDDARYENTTDSTRLDREVDVDVNPNTTNVNTSVDVNTENM